jgi:hypothetical protein
LLAYEVVKVEVITLKAAFSRREIHQCPTHRPISKPLRKINVNPVMLKATLESRKANAKPPRNSILPDNIRAIINFIIYILIIC